MQQEARQLDLFSGATLGFADGGRRPIDADRLADDALIAALPGASQTDAPSLAAACVQRKLTTAVPALEALCRRFKGFGLHAIVAEQRAALAGLRGIGGAAAAEAVVRLIVSGTVQGPGLALAVSAAAALHAKLPAHTALECLRHPDPAVRADACHCARSAGDVTAVLLDLLADLHLEVADAAACSLGRAGHVVARPRLVHCLMQRPAPEIIDAFAQIADDDGIVLLGRLATRRPDLTETILGALEVIDTERAAVVAAGVRRRSACASPAPAGEPKQSGGEQGE